MIAWFRFRYRKRLFALVPLVVALSSGTGLSQTRPEKEFEGRYGYLNGASIQFARSPRDDVFYAILDEAKYPLKRMGDGVYTDRDGSRVVFERGESGRVSGYWLYQEKATNFFRRIS